MRRDLGLIARTLFTLTSICLVLTCFQLENVTRNHAMKAMVAANRAEEVANDLKEDVRNFRWANDVDEVVSNLEKQSVENEKTTSTAIIEVRQCNNGVCTTRLYDTITKRFVAPNARWNWRQQPMVEWIPQQQQIYYTQPNVEYVVSDVAVTQPTTSAPAVDTETEQEAKVDANDSASVDANDAEVQEAPTNNVTQQPIQGTLLRSLGQPVVSYGSNGTASVSAFPATAYGSTGSYSVSYGSGGGYVEYSSSGVSSWSTEVVESSLYTPARTPFRPVRAFLRGVRALQCRRLSRICN